MEILAVWLTIDKRIEFIRIFEVITYSNKNIFSIFYFYFFFLTLFLFMTKVEIKVKIYKKKKHFNLKY